MTIPTSSTTPKGISLSRNNEGATVISHYTAGMLGLKIFAFVWSSIWLGATSFIMLKLWRDEGGFSNLLPALMGMAIVPFFFFIGVVVAAYFIWLLYKRTEISLSHSTLHITRRLGPFAKSHRYEKSRIKLFKVLQDGGQRKDSFPSFAVEVQLEGNAATLFSRQTPDVADWLCITLNEWLDKTKSNIFAGHDAPESTSPLPSTTAIIEARQKHLAHLGKWSWPTAAVMLVAVPLFLFRDPIATYLSKKIPLFPPIGEYPVQLRTSDGKYKIDHALRSAPILLDTTDDVTWKLTAKAAGQVAIENGKLVLKLDTFTIYDRFPCNPSSPCVKVIDVHFALATESGQSFSTIAESAPISISTVLPASGYKVGYAVVTLENNIDITAAQLATAWPIITVRSQTGDSGEPGSSHHAPPRDAWRTALIAGSTKGEAYWQQGCDAAKSLWAKIQMRCNAQLAQSLESKVIRQAETGMGNGDTPLMLAIDANNLEALAILLKSDVHVNAQSANGHAALNRAAERGYTEMVRRLIAAGANVEGTANPPARYEAPLAAAASFRRWDSVIALLQAGANPNARDSHSRAPVDYATYSPMGQPIDWDPTEPVRRIAALKLLLDKGARADDDVPLNEFTKKRPEYQKLRPLMYAARFGDTQAVSLLLAHGANINNPDSIGMTPLMIAIKMRQEAAVDVLLNAGADLKPFDSYGRAALNYATFNATPAIVKKVAAKGADLNLQSPAGMHHGETALMHAVQGGNIETLKAILALGAKTAIRDAKGLNALDHAKKRGNKEMIALLEGAL